MPRQLGLAAMTMLGACAGAVVEAPVAGTLFFFVPTGTADTWDAENTHAVPGGTRIPIPPRRRTTGPGPHRRMCPGDGGWHTDPAALRAAIEDAFGPRLGDAAEVGA
ncbi:hypothetical protein RM812_02030 [Streptomyces sp. DSM 40712]|uniref:Uncharacterized protein n=1 Tax=Streptomyces lancefieldiae TaxID=3075520 RepID=A0ABU3AFS9_9ACTN|nr:hypothetical protein [Streptomyces sp. DSM 40712]